MLKREGRKEKTIKESREEVGDGELLGGGSCCSGGWGGMGSSWRGARKKKQRMKK